MDSVSHGSSSPETPKRPAVSAAIARSSHSGARVLLVEDDDAMRKLCTMVLSRSGLRATSVTSGEEAWQELSKHQFDLLITDNNMPGLSGLDLIDLARRAGHAIPVIVASGTAPQSELDRANWAGYVRALPKPFLMADFLREVDAALGYAAARRGSSQAGQRAP